MGSRRVLFYCRILVLEILGASDYNTIAVPERPESEAQTRARRIDERLTHAGWSVSNQQLLTPTAITEYATLDGPADYLLTDNGPLAVVEAKRVSKGVAGVLNQAQRYARGLDAPKLYQDEFAVPFAYSTNGAQPDSGAARPPK